MIDIKGSNLKTREATLKRGLLIGGTFHKDLVLREEIIADCIGEAEEIAEAFGEKILSQKDIECTQMKNCLQFKRRLTKIGNITEEEIEKLTVKDFAEKLNGTDYAILVKCQTMLEVEMYSMMELTSDETAEVKKKATK